jgi:hypothetical protein
VKLQKKDRLLELDVLGRKNQNELWSLSLELLSLMFIYMGGFPVIEEAFFNSKEIDTTNLARKFNTDQYFRKSVLTVCKLNDRHINQGAIDLYRAIPRLPLYSMQYLISEEYKHMITTHKIVLLTHVIDGIVDDSVIPNVCNVIKNKYHKVGKIGNYEAKVFYLTDKTFFKCNRKYGAGIMDMLKVSRYQFVEIISDTRNSYSHFLPLNKKVNRLTKGIEILVYFEIIMFSIRLEMLAMMGIDVEEDMVKEYWYVIHDWIKDLKKRDKVEYKSKTYKIAEGIEEMNKGLNLLEERGDLT